jgi:hypothetical protein
VFIDIPEWLNTINTYLKPLLRRDNRGNVNLITRDANGNFYSTTGTVAGGVDSFLDYNAYIASLGQ